MQKSADLIQKEVQDYYGKTLQSSEDLQTNACCTPDAMPVNVKNILSQVHDEVLKRYYGCGLVIPENLAGAKVLDLGSGAGRDVYLLSALVGEEGFVTGVDMTPEQLEVAREYRDYHAKTFNFSRPNTEFLEGKIEELSKLDLPANHFDVIISNCVLNLCPDKASVLKEAYRVLRQGGEMYFSDVYADRRIPQELTSDPVLYGECLSGALYWNDFLGLATQAGFPDPRVVESRRITINDPKIEEKIGDIKFYSVTYRLFKIEELEKDCEDFGQSVTYQGGIPEHPESFQLDGHHLFPKGKECHVCGNTFLMLQKSRFQKHFTYSGDFSTHHGIFEGCGAKDPFVQETVSSCC